MRDASIEMRPDHMLIRIRGPAAALTPRREVVIPFSDIAEAKAEAPRWPALLDGWALGAFVPGVVAVGDFRRRAGGRGLLAFDRATKEALTLKLEGHPDFDEVCVQTAGARELAQLVGREANGSAMPWHAPAPRE